MNNSVFWKDLGILMLRCLAISLSVGFSAYLLVCWVESWRGLFWYLVSMYAYWRAFFYLLNPQKRRVSTINGKIVSEGHYLSLNEKLAEISLCLVVTAILFGFLWFVGWCCELVFSWPSDIIEYTLLKGILSIVGVVIALLVISYLAHCLKADNRRRIWRKNKQLLIGVMVVLLAISIAAGLYSILQLH